MIVRDVYSLHERAARGILGADEAERRELLEVCEALARSPSQPGTEQVIDESGRTHQVTYTARFRVVDWPDHAAKEVRIMDVRRYSTSTPGPLFERCRSTPCRSSPVKLPQPRRPSVPRIAAGSTCIQIVREITAPHPLRPGGG